MFADYASVTDLQKSPKKVFGKKPFQVILQNNHLAGGLLSQEFTELLMESGILEELQQELFELNDKETVGVIKNHRSGKSKPIAFDDFNKKYGL